MQSSTVGSVQRSFGSAQHLNCHYNTRFVLGLQSTRIPVVHQSSISSISEACSSRTDPQSASSTESSYDNNRRGNMMQRLGRIRTDFKQGLAQLRENRTGMIALSAIALPSGINSMMSDLLSNTVFMTGFWAFFLAQFGKFFTERFKKGQWDIKAIWQSGGTPSSHSSLCTGVTTAIGIVQGLGSPLFACATAFTIIVMYDAMGVRRHAGLHAQVLNRVVGEMSESEDHQLGAIADLQLKEVLGHTPRQVFAGGLLGIVVGIIYPLVAC